QYISLDIVDDGEVEQNETVILTLSNPTNAGLGSIIDHTYTIIDNEVGLVWDGLTWFYSGNLADLFINVDGDLEWSPQGGEQYITRIPDQALSQVGHVVQRSYYWLTDGQHNCADCFACPGGCYDDDITCIAGTSDMRVGLFEADGEWVTSDGFAVTGSDIFVGYKGYAWRFGPNMIAGPTRWVDCTSEVHKTGNFQKKPASLSNLMNTNDGLEDYIPGFELPPGEWSVLTVKLERTGSSSVVSSITLNDRTYTWTDSSASDQPGKIDVLAVHMRNHRPYSRLVLGSTTGPDNDPPSPDPMTWATTPYGSSSTAITMVATTATDISGVEYYFECTAGAGSDSGWQDNTIYVDTGLQPETSYTYRVMARDKSANQNPTGWSTEETGTTLASEPSKIAPTAITTTCSSVNYQLEGYYTSNENGLTGDLHTNLIGSNPAVPPPPGDGTMWLSNGIAGEWIQYEFDQIYTTPPTASIGPRLAAPISSPRPTVRRRTRTIPKSLSAAWTPDTSGLPASATFGGNDLCGANGFSAIGPVFLPCGPNNDGWSANFSTEYLSVEKDCERPSFTAVAQVDRPTAGRDSPNLLPLIRL
ncbi:MAG: fibronectin type III domain-containing protein, partial [Planctomycetota bacterium]